MSDKTYRQKIGVTGEDTACKYLIECGFRIIERNYLKKWGEIDIIAKKKGKIHFIEVKTVSCDNLERVTYETNESKKPEENVHPWKIQRLSRAIKSYLLEKKAGTEEEWQFDILSVFLDLSNKQAKIRFLEGVII